FSATAARMSAFNAFSSILSPSWKSMARLVLPSRLELKRPEGSLSEAPLAKVIFTTVLYVSPVQIIPACDHTGTPLHFHSSTTSGVGLLDENSDPSERLAPPITQLLDSRIYQLRGRVSSFSFLRAARPLLHGLLSLARHLSIASQHLLPSHLVSIRVFDVEPAYRVSCFLLVGEKPCN